MNVPKSIEVESQRYKPKAKPASKSYWGSKLLAGFKVSKGKHKCSVGQLTLWAQCQVSERPEVTQVVEKFVWANRALVERFWCLGK
jgi:hypothetical protein